MESSYHHIRYRDLLVYLSRLMKLCFLSHSRPAKVQARLRIVITALTIESSLHVLGLTKNFLIVYFPFLSSNIPSILAYGVHVSVNPLCQSLFKVSGLYWNQLMRLWHLSHKRPAKAQASLRIRAVSPEPSFFAHNKYRSRRRIRPKLRHLAPLLGCACVFET